MGEQGALKKHTSKRSRRQAITLKCLIFELAVAVN